MPWARRGAACSLLGLGRAGPNSAEGSQRAVWLPSRGMAEALLPDMCINHKETAVVSLISSIVSYFIDFSFDIYYLFNLLWV